MSQIFSLSPQTLPEIRTQIKRNLDAIAPHLHFSHTVGNIRYDPFLNSFQAKIQVNVENITLNKDECQFFRREIDACFKELLSINIRAKLGNISFSPNYFKSTINGEIASNSEGESINARQQAFKKYAHLYDLEPSDLNKHFKSRNYVFQIIGLSISRTKYPIVAKREDGRIFKFMPNGLKQKLY